MALVIAIIVLAFAAATCSADDVASACPPLPAPGSQDAQAMAQATAETEFPIKFPCYLPNTQRLESVSFTGEPGRQRVELVWNGPFDMTIRQSQYPPAFSPDPTGSTRITVNLTPSQQASLVQQNPATGDALYHMFWHAEDIYYEIQAFGPPAERHLILDIATSLEDYAKQQAAGDGDQSDAE